MKIETIFETVITLLIFTISFLHHRHLHAISGSFTSFGKTPSLLGDYRHLYLEQEFYFSYLCRDKQICTYGNWPGRIAQSVGHLTRKSGVLGSIPGLATYFRFSFRFFKKGSCQLLAKVCAQSTG